jgi:hypothetical protein
MNWFNDITTVKNKVDVIKETYFELICKTMDLEKKIHKFLSSKRKSREIIYILEELLEKSADLNWLYHELEDFVISKFEELKKRERQKRCDK